MNLSDVKRDFLRNLKDRLSYLGKQVQVFLQFYRLKYP